tara:strand:+ start:13170 stop:13313 length:144 start_codon:yes stop_codon:yes gene_type:complete
VLVFRLMEVASAQAATEQTTADSSKLSQAQVDLLMALKQAQADGDSG